MARFLYLLSFLLLGTVCHAALSPQLTYWESVLPDTPMPKAISDLLSHDVLADEKDGTYAGVGNGGVNVNTKGGTNVGGGNGGDNVNTTGKGGGTNFNFGHRGANISTKGKGAGTYFNFRNGRFNSSRNGTRPVIIKLGPGRPFEYQYAASDTQLHDNPNVALFFLEKALRTGAKMELLFGETSTSGTTFLPHQEADSIPFSLTKLPEILAHFSLEPNSVEASAMKETLEQCEEPTVTGEKKYCATSLESMVEFSVSSLGTSKVKAISTTISKEENTPQQYTIAGVHMMAGNELVACHPEAYAYAVFYCHSTSTSKAYMVEMVGTDGAKVDAVAVCHTDTKEWNPNHLAFKVLKVKRGTVPVCHFLPQDHVVWSRSG